MAQRIFSTTDTENEHDYASRSGGLKRDSICGRRITQGRLEDDRHVRVHEALQLYTAAMGAFHDGSIRDIRGQAHGALRQCWDISSANSPLSPSINVKVQRHRLTRLRVVVLGCMAF